MDDRVRAATRREANFNWVEARSQCSPEKVFAQLKLSIAEDARIRTEALLAERAGYGIDIASQGNTFIAFVSYGMSGNPVNQLRSVSFTLTFDRIVVKDQNDEAICDDARLTIDDEGECVFKIANRELDPWQFRKRTLERLLFESPWGRK